MKYKIINYNSSKRHRIYNSEISSSSSMLFSFKNSFLNPNFIKTSKKKKKKIDYIYFRLYIKKKFKILEIKIINIPILIAYK